MEVILMKKVVVINWYRIAADGQIKWGFSKGIKEEGSWIAEKIN
jgi:hypothetical protein